MDYFGIEILDDAFEGLEFPPSVVPWEFLAELGPGRDDFDVAIGQKLVNLVEVADRHRNKYILLLY